MTSGRDISMEDVLNSIRKVTANAFLFKPVSPFFNGILSCD